MCAFFFLVSVFGLDSSSFVDGYGASSRVVPKREVIHCSSFVCPLAFPLNSTGGVPGCGCGAHN